MASKSPQLKLGAFLFSTGHHVAAWRHPAAQADSGVNIKHYIELARAAERAKFDLVFLEDGLGVRERNVLVSSQTARAVHFEPVSLLAALAVQTRQIGLVGTQSTTYFEPYTVARGFTSLDHLSGGRAGWNMVTSATQVEAENFGLADQRLHADRYERAEEFIDVVFKLWDSWEDDTVIVDKKNGIFYDPAKLHPIDHEGRHFSVKGPLNLPRAPQGRPVLVQAGSSVPGKTLAARTAEVIFTAAQTLAEGQEFYGSVKEQTRQFGRDPDSLKIMPGIFPVVGRTESDARAKFEELQSLVAPAVGLSVLSHHLGGIDLSGYPLDEPIPEAILETQGNKSRQELLINLARRERLSIRELYLRIAGARGHWQVVGTPKEIADALEERFRDQAADGFNIMPPVLPSGLDDFIELVLPELRRRGLFRTEYEGKTLRENLGLRRPASNFAHQVFDATV